ncbi:Translation factor GUF1, mitochondrial [Trametes pubescens]|uniref:Translation factor GUF1, mitochondrial n=1 Tax=Trametes pubescens TaxID=154538 RepID=A0A1M2V9X7_TRAPU|nr:Translation factor GUF1, mitochondrial [Trametes pubescens]
MVAKQMHATFGIEPADVIKISAKTGKGVEEVLQAIIDRIPPPVGEPLDPLKAFLFDSSNDFLKLEESIKRLSLTDRSVEVTRETSSALGQGCRLGFLGTLHMDVFRQRLEDEYNADVIITAPTVPYKVLHRNGKDSIVSNPTDFPEPADFASGGRAKGVEEPIVKATIIVPEKYFSAMMELVFENRGTDLEWHALDADGDTSGDGRVLMTATLPLTEIVTDFFDKLKSRSSGFASFDYEDAGYQASDMRKMTFLLNGKPVDALALIVHADNAANIGRRWVDKLFKVIPRQLFEIPIQAAIGGKVLARRTLSAMRADVTAGLYGGHYERKMKHLNNQKESKRKMKRVGQVDLPQEAFFDLLSSK